MTPENRATQARSVSSRSIADPARGKPAIKVVLAIGFSLLIANLLTLYTHRPAGYTVDIYAALPLWFFTGAILCYVFASSALLSGSGVEKKMGILLLMLNHAAILLIPYMLGYYSMGRADDMTYIGEYVHISNVGSISPWNIYPASPIIGAALISLTGLPANEAAFVIPIVFSFIFIAGLYLFCRIYLREERQIQIALLASFVLYLGPYNFLNVPHALFFAFMPLYIFILLKFLREKTLRNSLFFIIPTALVPFMHPFIFLFVFILLLVMIVFGRWLDRYAQGNYRDAFQPLLLLVTGFLTWFIYNAALMRNFAQNYYNFIRKTTEPVLFETTDKISRISIDPFKLLELLFVYYGRYIIPFIVIVAGLAYVFLNREKVSGVLKRHMVFFSLMYAFFLAVEVLLFVNPIFSHEPDRLTNLNFIVYAQVPLFTLSLYTLSSRSKRVSGRTILSLVIIACIWSLSLWGTLASPHIFKTNEALTYNEQDGMAWLYDVKTSEDTIAPISQIGRFRDLFDEERVERDMSTPDHFGYGSDSLSFTEIDANEGLQGYFILLTMDELLYQRVPGYREVGRYTATDYIRFRSDRSIEAKIYDNRNIEIYT